MCMSRKQVIKLPGKIYSHHAHFRGDPGGKQQRKKRPVGGSKFMENEGQGSSSQRGLCVWPSHHLSGQERAFHNAWSGGFQKNAGPGAAVSHSALLQTNVLSCTLLDHCLLRGKEEEHISYFFSLKVTRGSTSKLGKDFAMLRDRGLSWMQELSGT